MPSVITFTSVSAPDRSEKRTEYPMASPSSVFVSSAMRRATELAAIRRGWVWPMAPRTPRPSSRQIFGSWVVLPDPVSPAITTTWWAAMAAAISSRASDTGSSGGNSSTGTAARRRSTRRAAASMSRDTERTRSSLGDAPSLSMRRRRRCWSTMVRSVRRRRRERGSVGAESSVLAGASAGRSGRGSGETDMVI